MYQLLLVLLGLVLVPPAVHAETISATSSLAMGDNDSRNDARNLCFLTAKNLALEKAGVYIESQTRVENLQLKSQDVRAFTAAIVRVEDSSHSFTVTGNQQVVNCGVKLSFDQGELKRRLNQFASDVTLRAGVVQQQARISELERRVATLTQELTSVEQDKAPALRRQRQDALVDIKAIEAALASWGVREERLQRLKRLALEYVKIGMTREEVRTILGPPDRTDYTGGSSWWYYGPQATQLTVIFDQLGTASGTLGPGYVKAIYGAAKK